MGQNCSVCIRDSSNKDKEFTFEKEPRMAIQQTAPEIPTIGVSLDLGDIIKLQGVLRGYLDRKQVRSIFKSRTIQNMNSNNNVQSLQPREELDVLTGKIPDYSNYATRAAAAKFGEFVYNNDFNDGMERIKKEPVQLENGAIYIGEWNINNERHGRGMQMWSDGSRYDGYWRHDKANGKGRLIHADGDVYEGDWVDDKAQGYGIYVHNDGARYQGEWLDDKQHGQGVESWPDGAKYQGGYRNGQKHGMGKFIWADGSQYDGEFFNNNIHGKGVYKWSDGRMYSGQWKNNKMDGEGVFAWADGRSYTGYYVDDKKQGFGIFKWPDGRRYEGNWQNGKQHGKGIYISPQGLRKEGEWKDGKRIRWIDDNENQILQQNEKRWNCRVKAQAIDGTEKNGAWNLAR